MSAQRLFAVLLILAGVSVGWMILGQTMQRRTDDLDERLSGEIRNLWGPKVVVQPAPFRAGAAGRPRTGEGSTPPESSKITATFKHEHRYKGLLWYSMFTVTFEAEYTFAPAGQGEGGGVFVLPLPAGVNGYDGLEVRVNDQSLPLPPDQISDGRLELALPPEDGPDPPRVHVQYETNGQEAWVYAVQENMKITDTGDDGLRAAAPGKGLTELRNFSLTVRTNFEEIDYLPGTRSPNEHAKPAGNGMEATWEFAQALTNQSIGLLMPKRPNAGPIVTRMSMLAPVSLLLFFTVLLTVVALKLIPLHPMHYLLISAGFFAFHILLAYLVDKIPIHAAFWICAAVSVLLVVSYMRLVAGVKFAVVYVGAAQLVYLLGFSYAFFLPGWTGLAVVIGAILTLFVLMQSTGRVDWFQFFRRPDPYGLNAAKRTHPAAAALGAGAQSGPVPLSPPPIPATPPAGQGGADKTSRTDQTDNPDDPSSGRS